MTWKLFPYKSNLLRNRLKPGSMVKRSALRTNGATHQEISYGTHRYDKLAPADQQETIQTAPAVGGRWRLGGLMGRGMPRGWSL